MKSGNILFFFFLNDLTKGKRFPSLATGLWHRYCSAIKPLRRPNIPLFFFFFLINPGAAPFRTSTK